MASLLYPDDGADQSQWPTSLLPVDTQAPPSDPRADALGDTYRTISDYMARQQAQSEAQGYWTGGSLLEGGHPTGKGLLDAIGQTGTAVALGTGAPGEKPPPGFTVYHGSPHLFPPTEANPLGQFRDSAISSGEGGQAFGYGHYGAEAEGVARGYRDRLAAKFQPAEKTETEDALNQAVAASNEAARSVMAKGFDFMSPEVEAATRPHEELIKALQDKLNNIQTPPGHMYEVQVNADPEHFLHWDKPLNQQSDHVRQAIANSPYAGYELTSLPGSQLVPHTAAGAQALADAGIPGIRYLDQGSRHAGEGTHNVVVFDPATMEIIRRYGLAGLMAGGGAAALGGQQRQQQQ